MRTLNSLNSPIRLSTSIMPPCSWVTMSQLIERPSPVPLPVGLVVKNSWNNPFRRILRRGRDALDALNEVGITEHALRFEKVQYLEQQFVHGGIFGGEAEQPLCEIQTLL
jgi:hypothetical protein